MTTELFPKITVLLFRDYSKDLRKEDAPREMIVEKNGVGWKRGVLRDQNYVI